MVDRLIPYKEYSYERDLIEYCGTVFVDELNRPRSHVTPGILVSRQGTGLYTISCLDKLPIFNEIANTDAVPADLSCIDKGYASSCMIWVALRPQFNAPTDVVQIASSTVNIVDRAQISFNVETAVAGVDSDLPFCFRIWVTGQPAKFVQGSGA